MKLTPIRFHLSTQSWRAKNISPKCCGLHT
jgi:hypothetical protein